jgi:hypothetical protein
VYRLARSIRAIVLNDHPSMRAARVFTSPFFVTRMAHGNLRPSCWYGGGMLSSSSRFAIDGAPCPAAASSNIVRTTALVSGSTSSSRGGFLRLLSAVLSLWGSGRDTSR